MYDKIGFSNFIFEKETVMNTMQKTMGLFLTAALFTQVAVAETTKAVETRHAIEISINGNGYVVDKNSYKKVRKAIGDAVTNDVIDKFVIYGYAKEGGFSACVEDRPSSNPPSAAFEKFVKQLNAIKPPRKTTGYSINRVQTCPALPVTDTSIKPKTVFVEKSDGSKQCDATSGISLADMQKQLTDMVIYSSTKKSDGLMHITLCGAETGMFNVYEIAQTDLEKAKMLGFTEWVE